MDDLIARLEAAAEGSRELDARIIARLVGGEAHESPHNGEWCVYKGTNVREELQLWQPTRTAEARWRYTDTGPTRSLDSAPTLVPDEMEYTISTLYKVANVEVGLNVEEGPWHAGRPDCNVALAAVTAVLRALQATTASASPSTTTAATA